MNAGDLPVVLLQTDEQIKLEPGTIARHVKSAIKILTPAGLSAGNVTLAWNPATDEMLIHRLEIHRGDRITDILASGQKFTILRRESNLETATLDGMLTATLQPEGLQSGDIVVLESTQISRDPVMKNHVEAWFGNWDSVKAEGATSRLIYPRSLDLRVREVADLPATSVRTEGAWRVRELSMRKLDPVIYPANAPARFRIARVGEATDFKSWGELADLFVPLYRSAAQIPASGPLRDEVERIRAATTDSAARAQMALDLVQDRVRYVALLLGQGGYVPATAEQTWSRRYGDCKGKSVLLVALLGELGISAEAVLVNSRIGDAIPEQLPMVALFDHVIVRAKVGDRHYWLDGTRTGDKNIAELAVPAFHWGLPLIERAGLVRIEAAPLTRPEELVSLMIDASNGAKAAAAITARAEVKGEQGTALNLLTSALSVEQREAFLRDFWERQVDFVSPTELSSTFDQKSQTYRMDMRGTGVVEWDNDRFWVPLTSLGYKANFERKSGINRTAPVAIPFPSYSENRVRIRMPAGFFAGRKQSGSAAVSKTLGGVEYRRTFTSDADSAEIVSSARSITSEVPYAQARADQPKIIALSDEDVALTLPKSYQLTAADLKALNERVPDSKSAYFDRGLTYLGSDQYDKAIADFDRAIDESDPFPYANRALAHILSGRLEQGRADIASAAALDPQNYVLLHARGMLAEKESKWDEALAAYSEAIAQRGKNGWALSRKATIAYQLNRNSEALADSARALLIDPGAADIRLLRANILIAAGNKADAGKEAEALVTHRADDAYSHVIAARIFAKIGQRDRALDTFDRALAIKPSAIVYLNRASIRTSSEAALRTADIAAAAKLEPTNENVLMEQASDLVRHRRYSEAITVLRSLVKQNEDANSFILGELGVALSKAGRVDEARQLLTKVRSRLKAPLELNSFCWSLATGNVAIDLALDACREAVRQAPEVAGYIDSLALAEFRAGLFAQALANYDKAIRLRPDQSSSLMGRALIHSKMGDRAKAAADAERAKSIDHSVADEYALYGLTL